MIKSKKQMFTIIGAFLLMLTLFTTTYAFFNYTRSGSANNIKTGRIVFNTEQDGVVTLSDLFPIDASGNITSSTPGVGSLFIHVTGDTTYNEGIEYLIKSVEVTSTSGTELPVSIRISYEANGEGKTIGESDDDYFTNRGGNTSIYKVLSTNTISENGDLVVGYIAPDQTGIDGNLTILAYLDANNIAITDTYDEDNPETDDNGTSTNWVAGRTVLTTEEWNALQSSGISFKVKVSANEGIWVENPNKPICRRVTNVAQLHTEECSNISDYCYEDGYVVGNLGTTITYGNAKAIGSTLTKGDAFDCDVNGDGNYTERFYYVSPYFNTDTLTFDDENGYATLIYYSNTLNGVASMDNSAYDSTNENWHGPSTAKTHLPTAQQWPNISLKNTTRTILAENYSLHNQLITGNGNQTIDNPFSYSGYSARLLSAQELMNACNLTQLGKYSRSELSNCQFLFERTEYNDLHTGSEGIWLENPNGYGQIWYLLPMYRYVNTANTNDTRNGTRPVIDVLYSKIEY